jgi:hypothetical protein
LIFIAALCVNAAREAILLTQKPRSATGYQSLSQPCSRLKFTAEEFYFKIHSNGKKELIQGFKLSPWSKL